MIFDEPRYDNYFPRVTERYQTQEICEADGYQWIPTNQSKTLTGESGDVYVGHCDTRTKNQAQWDEVRGEFEKKTFMALVGLGIVTIILAVIIKNYVVSLGLGLGAFLDFIIASMRYWRYSDDWLRIVILVVALAVLIWLAIKKFGDT